MSDGTILYDEGDGNIQHGARQQNLRGVRVRGGAGRAAAIESFSRYPRDLGTTVQSTRLTPRDAGHLSSGSLGPNLVTEKISRPEAV